MTLYVTTEQVKAAFRMGTAVTDDDTLISMAGSAASGAVDKYCGRTFGTVAATRRYAAGDSCVLRVHDLAGTAVTVATASAGDRVYDLAWSASDWQLEPLDGIVDGVAWPYTQIRAVGSYRFPVSAVACVEVTGVFGWPSVPPEVVDATLLLSQRLYKRFESATGVLGFGEMGAIRVTRNMDPDIAFLLADYRTGAAAAGGIA